MNELEPFARLLFTPPNELIKELERNEFGINFEIEADDQKFAVVVLYYLENESLQMLSGLMNELCLDNNSKYSIFFNKCLFCIIKQANYLQKVKIKAFFQEGFYCIDPEYLFDVCSKLEIVVNTEQLGDYAVYLGLCKQFRKSMRLMRDFGIIEMVMRKINMIKLLVENQAFDLCKQLIGQNLEWAALATTYLAQQAPLVGVSFIKDYCLDPKNYPSIALIPKRDHLAKLLKDPDFTIYNCIKIIYDDLSALAGFVECLLINYKKELWAKKISSFLLNTYSNISSIINPDLLNLVNSAPSCVLHEPPDTFSPINKDCWSWPQNCKLIYISNEKQMESFNWPNEHRIGFDSEWKISIGELTTNKPSLLQLAFSEQVILIDILGFKDKQILDQKLFEIFYNENILKIGVNLKCDLKTLSKSFPEMKCFKFENFRRHVDLVTLHKKHYKTEPGGLSNLSEMHISGSVCKNERFSNWELRPLRNSQLHYASMDALISLSIFVKIEKQVELDASDFCIGFKKSDKIDENELKPIKYDLCMSKLNESKSTILKCKFCGISGHLIDNCPYIG